MIFFFISKNQAICAPPHNLALNKSISASSAYIAGNQWQWPSLAVDGNNQTKWYSGKGVASASILVDLQALCAINNIKINWPTGYAKSYTVELSQDNSNFLNIYSKINGTGNDTDITFSYTKCRYIKINLLERQENKHYFIINELEIRG